MARAYRITRDEPSTSLCLHAAFRNDPLFRTMFPSDAEYETTALWMFQKMGWALGASYGMVDVIANSSDGKIICAAGWEPADMSFMGAVRFIYMFGLFFLRTGLMKTVRLGGLFLKMESLRHHHAPTAHHLQVLGTEPAEQGKGVGSKLIEYGIARATAAGKPCYLESSNPKNVPFYERHGFKVVERYYPFKAEGAVDGDGNVVEGEGPVATLMLRELNHKKKD